MPRISTVLLFIFLFALLFWAVNLKDPHLFSYRKVESATILLLCSGGVFMFSRKSERPQKISGMILIGIISFITLYGEAFFHYKKRVVLSRDQEIVRRLGEHFIVGYDSIDELRPLLANGVVGGVFITRRNAGNKSFEDLRLEIAELQKIRKDAGLPKLIVATDQEGGSVSRLSPPLKFRESLADLINKKSGKDEMLAMSRKYGAEQGKELADVGITLNFSPVVDLKSDRPRSSLDFHSRIDQRAISKNPELTADVASAYIQGLESQGVSATLKHFPGLGGVATDTHHFSAKLETSANDLSKLDWIPFQRISAQSGTMIMLGHVILSTVDNKNPVSFSLKVTREIIRGQLKHDGLLITDDLTMAAAYNHGIGNSVVKSLNAGVDLMLVSFDHEKIYDAMYYAVVAYKKGKLDENELELSHSRIKMSAKKFFPSLQTNQPIE